MKRLLFLIIALSITACAGTPPADTAEKKLFAAEVTWQKTLEAVQKNAHRLSAEQKSQVRSTLIDANAAITAARAALQVGDLVDFSDRIAAVNSSINVLRALLEQIEAGELSHNERNDYFKRDYHPRFDSSRFIYYDRDIPSLSPG